jgi:hypothetical protein
MNAAANYAQARWRARAPISLRLKVLIRAHWVDEVESTFDSGTCRSALIFFFGARHIPSPLLNTEKDIEEEIFFLLFSLFQVKGCTQTGEMFTTPTQNTSPPPSPIFVKECVVRGRFSQPEKHACWPSRRLTRYVY